MKKVWVTLIAFLVVLIALTACMTPYRTAIIEPNDVQFAGIFERSKSEPIDIVSVHGMCTHKEDWVEEIVSQISIGLELEAGETSKYTTQDDVVIYTTEMSGNGGRRARNFAILWSPLTSPLKLALCYDSDKSTGSCEDPGYKKSRGKINSTLKSVLINDCFSDAVIYAGDNGPRIRSAMRVSIDYIQTQRAGINSSPMFLISSSLGSEILAEALVEDLTTDSGVERIQGLGTLKQVYMAANQIPLLKLSRDAGGDRAPELTPMERLRNAIEASASRGGEREERIQFIAFTDPNDLLSYGLQPDEDTFNVTLSNVPTYFGLFANPWPVHTSYLTNSEFWRVVVCGSDIENCQ